MIYDLLILLCSLFFLLYSADKLVDAAVNFATRMGMSKMVVGLTIVAIGTSLPEVMASSAAAWKGHAEIALGNVVGSNICNIALILGLPALISTISTRRAVLRREGVLMILLTLVVFSASLLVGNLGRGLGLLFVGGFAAFIYTVFKNGVKEGTEEEISVEPKLEETGRAAIRQIAGLAVFLAILLLSSEFLVQSTVSMARELGVSEAVIAISIIALGTSLPELSVSFAAVKRREGDILVGNVLGSNITNILLVLGISSLIQPIRVGSLTVLFDLPMMLLLAILMVGFLYHEKGVNRQRGILFLSLYGLVMLRCIIFPSA